MIEGDGSFELVSGKEEALLGFSSFRHECSLDRGVLTDIGGTARAVCKLVNHLCRRECGTNEFSTSDLELLHEVLYAGQDTAREGYLYERVIGK